MRISFNPETAITHQNPADHANLQSGGDNVKNDRTEEKCDSSKEASVFLFHS